jgi:hypothetical protein
MRYAVNLPNFADYADVWKVAALAAEAEAAWRRCGRGSARARPAAELQE